jgi:hypothetical protein
MNRFEKYHLEIIVMTMIAVGSLIILVASLNP